MNVEHGHRMSACICVVLGEFVFCELDGQTALYSRAEVSRQQVLLCTCM